MSTSSDQREWTIRVCRNCGCPLGAAIAAMLLVKCPDCHERCVPIEDVTDRVVVYAAEDADAERDRLDGLGCEVVEALGEAITGGYDPPRRLENARAKWIYRNHKASHAA